MNAQLQELTRSVDRLRSLVADLDEGQLTAPAFPTEWTVAQTLSHLGSGAVIMRTRLDATAAGDEVPADFNQSVWDEWNAKLPVAQRDGVLAADAALIERAGSLTDAEWTNLTFTLGPMTLDTAGLVGMRLNEHALHTWDVEVALDPAATVPASAAALIVDTVGMLVRFTGKSDGNARTITIHTTDPDRDVVVVVTADGLTLEPAESAALPDITMPAESLVRLVYGRLDAEHTPSSVSGNAAELDALRHAFPGF